MKGQIKAKVRDIANVVTVLLFGLMAGFFATYSFNVNYAMLAVDGQTYATVQSLFNVNVRHLGFFVCFFGGGVAPIITALIWYPVDRKVALVWFILGVFYIGGIIFFTKFVNLPLNYYTESWNPAALPQDWQEVRLAWNQANLFRAGLSIGVFVISLILLCRKQSKSTQSEQLIS